jgi:serine/threonine protein kinase
MTQPDPHLIGDIYQTGHGRIITTNGMLTTMTAYNQNTNTIVGLHLIHLETAEQIAIAQNHLQSLNKRKGFFSENVMRVHDWGIDAYQAYIATDPPRGVTLQYLMDNEDLDLKRSIDIVHQLLVGLKIVHKHGINGLDLRPQLITIDTIGVHEKVQIDDIVGLRSFLLSLGYVSRQNGNDIGFLDPRYAAPEYLTNTQIGPWSDIYQAGILLFTLVTGYPPFIGRTPAETGQMQSEAPIPHIQQHKYDAPPALQDVLEHAMAKDPAQRYPNADAFINALNLVPVPTPSGRFTGDMPTSQPSINLTKEMAPLKNDNPISMREVTQHAIPPASPQSANITAGHGQNKNPIMLPQLPTTTGVYAYLCFEHSHDDIERFALAAKTVIVGRLDPKRGTMPDVDLSKLDPTKTVSRQHARITFEDTFFSIEDLKSRNRTRLGDLPLTPLKADLIQHGDTVQFGKVRMTFAIPGMETLPILKK